MKRPLRMVRQIIRRFGFDVVHWREWPVDFQPDDIEIGRRVAPFTQTPRERVFALKHAVEYVSRHQVPGAIVECGVWRGGSMMTVALTLQRENDTRDLYLYDTFEGMTAPADGDVNVMGLSGARMLATSERRVDPHSAWCYAPLELVREAMGSTGYDADRVHFVVGPVETTIPATMPAQIALLRLDTDWYESTKHELEHLYPLLAPGGVLIVDDYGYWAGNRRAMDEYIAAHNLPLLLHRTDYGCRVAVKPG